MRKTLYAVLGGLILFAIVTAYWSKPAQVPQKDPSPPSQPPEAKPKTSPLTFAFDGVLNEQSVPSPWRLVVSSGKAELAVRNILAVSNIPEAALHVRTSRASYFLARDDQPFDFDSATEISWSWRADTLPTGGDIRKSSLLPFADNRNDQALQLLVTFDDKRVISYVWDTTAPEGTEVKEQNPFANIMAVVVESGPDNLGAPRAYRRKLGADYGRLHGGLARRVIAVAVQTNSNHTRSEAEGYFLPIEIHGGTTSAKR